MKQVAYLSVSPSKDGRVTRAQACIKTNTPMPLPNTHGCNRLIAVLEGAGFQMSGGMGPVPLSSTELKNYCEGIGIKLYPEEFAKALQLSKVYLRAHSDYTEDKSAMPPYMTPETIARINKQREEQDK